MTIPTRIAPTRTVLEGHTAYDLQEIVWPGHQGDVPNPIPASEAIQIADALTRFRLRFYEEPLAYNDVDGYSALRARSCIPIAAFLSYIHRMKIAP
jgi:hypothetical protein